MPQITCANLSVGYNGMPVLKGLNLEVSKGDYLCIVGENGSGKSTLMKTLLSLLPPVEGTVSYGEDVNPREIGYLPQQTPIQKDFPAVVGEIVLSGCIGRCKAHPFYCKHQKLLAAEKMELMHISDLSKKCYRDLSGGQQQRVLLARALCAAGELLLLDEPVAGLDPLVTEELYETVRELNADGLTVIMISHDMSATLKYATHVLYAAKTPFYGTKTEFEASNYAKRLLAN